MSKTTPIYQWTNGGSKVLLIKCVRKDGTSHDGFQWPKSGHVKSPNWAPEPTCESGGLFGWPWGVGIGVGKSPDYTGIWVVFAADPSTIVWLDGKAKVPEAEVLFYGMWYDALAFVANGRDSWIKHASDGASSATGIRGASSATGDDGASSATGDRGASSATGDGGASSATGYRGASSATGYGGASSAAGDGGASSATGYRGASSATGDGGIAATTGEYSILKVSATGIAVTTARECFWIYHHGAVLIQRWTVDDVTNVKVFASKMWKKNEGKRARIIDGRIVEWT